MYFETYHVLKQSNKGKQFGTFLVSGYICSFCIFSKKNRSLCVKQDTVSSERTIKSEYVVIFAIFIIVGATFHYRSKLLLIFKCLLALFDLQISSCAIQTIAAEKNILKTKYSKPSWKLNDI